MIEYGSHVATFIEAQGGSAMGHNWFGVDGVRHLCRIHLFAICGTSFRRNRFWRKRAGIGFTLYQVWETKRLARDAKRASDAAREATDKAIGQLTSSNYRYSLLSAKTLLREASAFVMAKRWSMASLRVMDVAGKASELAYARPLKDDVWVEATTKLREWARIFGEIQTNRNFDGALNDWDDLCNVLHDKIDKECGPFGLGEEV